jgi:hypothetical protein
MKIRCAEEGDNVRFVLERHVGRALVGGRHGEYYKRQEMVVRSRLMSRRAGQAKEQQPNR